ncbi:unnamed protein product [Strongylus vulgaris]|uniref:Uncharacterized protein n=1 Tax=Strongylus vulgaris TaxID=40348 RepID=A0A3P7L1C2_STRVU|nr:unnamed protein product [Strongylus vulgaris]
MAHFPDEVKCVAVTYEIVWTVRFTSPYVISMVPGPRTLIFPVLARLLFIPYFMLCNYNVDDRVMPVVFKNEWWFIIGNIIMAFTSGYFSSLGMMYAPRWAYFYH